jgi:hypothetical protein
MNYQTTIEKQIKIIKKVTKELLAQGPEACRKFLVDAGIIKR